MILPLLVAGGGGSAGNSNNANPKVNQLIQHFHVSRNVVTLNIKSVRRNKLFASLMANIIYFQIKCRFCQIIGKHLQCTSDELEFQNTSHSISGGWR